MAQLGMKPKPHSHHIDGIPNYLLEANRPKFSLEDRLLVAAQRLLDEPQGGMNGNGLSYPLRYHQLPAFTNFSTYLMDFATRPDNASISPYCRIVLPPRTGKTVVAGNIIARTGLNSTFVVPTKTLIRQVRLSRLFQVHDHHLRFRHFLHRITGSFFAHAAFL